MALWLSDVFESIWKTNFMTTLALLMLTSVLCILTTQRRRGIPPGPRPWPIVGNIPSVITKDVFGRLHKLRMKYGDVYGLYVGTELSIILNGFDVINDAFVKKGSTFAVRPIAKFKQMIMATNGIVFANGTTLKKRRAFGLRALNGICFLKKEISLDERVNAETAQLMERLENAEQPTDPKDHMDLSFANIMYSIVHGRRIGYKNEDFKWYMNHLKEQFTAFTRNQILLSCFSFLNGFPFDPLGLKQMDATRNTVREYHRKMCEPNFENYVEGSNENVVDCYITNMLKDATTPKMQHKDTNYPDYFDEPLWNMVHDLVAAGSETCATTFNWIILHLALNHDVRMKLHDEIDDKLGPNNIVTLEDRERLPYAQATVLEGLRISVVVPLALPHGVNEDTMFRGYLIPKGAQVYANIASVLKDPNIFEDPEVFRPERFLTNDLKSVCIPKEFIPFSAGPRSCIGESLAKQELFLYTVNIFQKFDVVLGQDEKPSTTVGEFSVTYRRWGIKTS